MEKIAALRSVGTIFNDFCAEHHSKRNSNRRTRRTADRRNRSDTGNRHRNDYRGRWGLLARQRSPKREIGNFLRRNENTNNRRKRKNNHQHHLAGRLRNPRRK